MLNFFNLHSLASNMYKNADNLYPQTSKQSKKSLELSKVNRFLKDFKFKWISFPRKQCFLQLTISLRNQFESSMMQKIPKELNCSLSEREHRRSTGVVQANYNFVYSCRNERQK